MYDRRVYDPPLPPIPYPGRAHTTKSAIAGGHGWQHADHHRGQRAKGTGNATKGLEVAVGMTQR